MHLLPLVLGCFELRRGIPYGWVFVSYVRLVECVQLVGLQTSPFLSGGSYT
jgi:hypothetical protein